MVQKIMDNSSSFEHEQIGFVKFWEKKIIPVFAPKKVLKFNSLKKKTELYEVQWSRLLHLWSSKEATGDEKKMC